MERVGNNMETMIYVIIPVYNCKKYIENAVNSVLKQPYKKIEIVIVDDGSTDGSEEMCNNFARCNERVHTIHQENSGVSSARNTGIEYVIRQHKEYDRGYVAFLDVDDAWLKESIDNRVEKILCQELDLIGFQSCMCDYSMSYREKPRDLNEGFKEGGSTAVWNFSTQSFAAMFYSIELLKKFNLRFFQMKYSEDKIFLMQSLYLANQMYLENRLVYLYRDNGFSAMHSRKMGIEYFLPIVEGYLKSDLVMEKWANNKRGTLQEGNKMARLYLMDMINEHYMCGGKREDIKKLFEINKQFLYLLNNESIGGEKDNQKWMYMVKHPYRTQIKSRIYGLLKKALKNSFIKERVDKRKYSIKI